MKRHKFDLQVDWLGITLLIVEYATIPLVIGLGQIILTKTIYELGEYIIFSVIWVLFGVTSVVAHELAHIMAMWKFGATQFRMNLGYGGAVKSNFPRRNAYARFVTYASGLLATLCFVILALILSIVADTWGLPKWLFPGIAIEGLLTLGMNLIPNGKNDGYEVVRALREIT